MVSRANNAKENFKKIRKTRFSGLESRETLQSLRNSSITDFRLEPSGPKEFVNGDKEDNEEEHHGDPPTDLLTNQSLERDDLRGLIAEFKKKTKDGVLSHSNKSSKSRNYFLSTMQPQTVPPNRTVPFLVGVRFDLSLFPSLTPFSSDVCSGSEDNIKTTNNYIHIAVLAAMQKLKNTIYVLSSTLLKKAEM